MKIIHINLNLSFLEVSCECVVKANCHISNVRDQDDRNDSRVSDQ